MAEPRRGYSWRDAWPGNDLALKHGARSERRWRPIAERVAAELPELAPWVTRPAFVAALHRYARAEAIASLLGNYLDKHGPLDDDGNPRPALASLAAWDRRAELAAERLGLDPLSMAKVMTVLAGQADAADAALEQLRAEGRAIVEARTAALTAGYEDGAT